MNEVFRLTFQYRGGEFVALDAERIRMVAPDPFGHLDGPPAPGHYAELRAPGGEVLRTAAFTEDLTTVEYSTGDPERPFGRAPLADGMLVSTLIPADDRAVEAALVEVAVATGVAGTLERVRRDLAVIGLPREDQA